jgi:hypothetical protein
MCRGELCQGRPHGVRACGSHPGFGSGGDGVGTLGRQAPRTWQAEWILWLIGGVGAGVVGGPYFFLHEVRDEPERVDIGSAEAESALMRPVLLVDLDGVVNVFPVGIQDVEAWTAESEFTFKVRGATFRVPRGIRERFRRLESVFDCVWATGWGEDAASFIHEHLGFGRDWPVIRFMIGGDGQTWKLRQVQRWCDDNAA